MASEGVKVAFLWSYYTSSWRAGPWLSFPTLGFPRSSQGHDLRGQNGKKRMAKIATSVQKQSEKSLKEAKSNGVATPSGKLEYIGKLLATILFQSNDLHLTYF